MRNINNTTNDFSKHSIYTVPLKPFSSIKGESIRYGYIEHEGIGYITFISKKNEQKI